MANITTTSVNDGLATIVAASLLGHLKANTVFARLVNRNYENEIMTRGQSVKIPFTGALSANDKAADTVVTLQAPADTAVTVTLDKHKEVSFLIEDPAKAMATPDYLAQYTADAAAVIAEQIDADIAALYTGFSTTPIDATAGLGDDDFREARRLLNAAKAPLSNRYVVLHEDAEFQLLGIEKATNRDYAESLGGGALADSFVTRFMGFDIFMSQNIPVATSENKNLAFHRDAIAFATRPLPVVDAGMGVVQTIMAEDGHVIRITMGYDKSHLGMQVTVDTLYGVAELRDPFGVVIRTTEI